MPKIALVDDDRIAARAIELLKQRRAGRLTFLPLNKIRGGTAMAAFVARITVGTVTAHHGHMPEIDILSPTSAKGTESMTISVSVMRRKLR